MREANEVKQRAKRSHRLVCDGRMLLSSIALTFEKRMGNFKVFELAFKAYHRIEISPEHFTVGSRRMAANTKA